MPNGFLAAREKKPHFHASTRWLEHGLGYYRQLPASAAASEYDQPLHYGELAARADAHFVRRGPFVHGAALTLGGGGCKAA